MFRCWAGLTEIYLCHNRKNISKGESMTVLEVSKELGISDRTIRYWIDKGTNLGPYFEKRGNFYTVKRVDFKKFSQFYKGKK